ncbi:ROK family protein [Vibrio sp. NTOU-M3]|uniref:ROK family protein n=1 Tax=Vibrio sp. NTOU-M3 TaxID=3234954 RepID=UPI00349F8C3F
MNNETAFDLTFNQRLASLLQRQEENITPLSEKRKSLLLRAISCQTSPTRKSLSSEFKLRPATVTELVGELIELNLVREDKTINPSKPGRPEVYLHLNERAASAIVITIDSLTINAHLINLKGQIVCHASKTLSDHRLSNQDMLEQFEVLATTLLNKAPEENVVGIACSVPGLVDEHNVCWVFSNRWPQISHLSFDALAQQTRLPVRVAKNLNNELRARLLRHPEHAQESVLNIHWGYGIGTSYALRGEVLHTPTGGFGELGQTTLTVGEETPSIESVASLRAMEAALRQRYQNVPNNEADFVDFFQSHNTLEVPNIIQAIQVMSTTLRNAFLTLFPQKIIITGPLAQSSAIFEQLKQTFVEQLPEFAREHVSLQVGQRAKADEIFGAVSPLFQSAIKARLSSSHKKT